ncbi:hypothetical protein [Methyloferula stellata]|uniref:hypothetical protein n=1 Tax=Methyloferula stellata TaxID=876270 RepID=UPI00037E7ED5|nr:hypothetical protein [Methyloferula stellata]
MRGFACALLGALAVSSLPETASAGPMSISSGPAILAASPAQIEDVRYYARRRYVHRRYNPGPAIAGAALGLMGAAALGAMSGGGYGYGYGYPAYGGYPYGYGYGYPYGYGYRGW